jgi:Protein of unknown function (DUF3303)
MQIMECQDRALLDTWMSRWADIVDFEVIPVMSSGDAASLVATSSSNSSGSAVGDNPNLLDSLFRDAVAAIDAGDVPTLERLLAEHPELLSDRLGAPGAWLRDKVGDALDGFFERPYLLWFVAEDPVRNRKLPANIAQVAQAMIRAAERTRVPR